jgi:CheY-like chemotaxis protein
MVPRRACSGSFAEGAAETSARVPAIALTASASKKDRDLALNAGFDAHLPKPVDVAALASTIERLVRPQLEPGKFS